jgi:integrase
MTKTSRKGRKRENGDGTFWPRKNGTFMVQVAIPHTKGKERLNETVGSRDAARVKAQELKARALQIAADRANGVGSQSPEVLTVRAAVAAFLAELEGAPKTKPGTYSWYMRYLNPLCAFALEDGPYPTIGDLPFSKFRKDHLKKLIAANRAREKRPWGDSAAHAAGRCAMTLCNWLVESDAERFETISKSPLKDFEKAPSLPRDCYITKQEWKRALEAADDELRDQLKFMRYTGARPEELRFAEKRHFDPSIPALIFAPKEWKCGLRGKVPKERVIRLAGEALLIIQKRCLRYPTGRLFRTYKNLKKKDPKAKGFETEEVPVITKDSLARRFKRLAKKLKIPHLIPYACRHTYASDAAFKVEAFVLADLMGTSVKMLEQYYTKVRKRQDLMGQAAARAIEDIA